MHRQKDVIANVCFYCKKPIKDLTRENCPDCRSALRTIKVQAKRICISPWYALRKKYTYSVLDPKFKYLEHRLNDGV